jgi:hypothetical protein
VDQLAAAYERAAETPTELPLAPATGDPQTPRPPATGRRQDNLLLYLDTDDAEAGG